MRCNECLLLWNLFYDIGNKMEQYNSCKNLKMSENLNSVPLRSHCRSKVMSSWTFRAQIL